MSTRTAWLLLALPLLFASASAASTPVLEARLECEPSSAPGRVVCALTTRALRGKLVWSDALIVVAPSFARPLRSRVASRLTAEAGQPGTAIAKLALVASEPGRGSIELLARAVVCGADRASEVCSPELERVSAVVEVAPRSP